MTAGLPDTAPDETAPPAVAPSERDAPLAPAPFWATVAVFLAAAAVGGVERWWQLHGRVPIVWNDTADFMTASRASWWSAELWAGRRAAGAPVLLKLVGRDTMAYVSLQAVVAVAAWAALAAAVFAATPGRARALAALVVGFSVTSPVTMWDASVLSESMAISLGALAVAAGLWVARGVTGPRVGALLAVLVAWALTRDTHMVVTLVGGLVVAAGLALAWWRDRRQGRDGAENGGDTAGARRGGGRNAWWGVLALGAMAISLVVAVASAHGERHAFPMRNVYEVRVLPYPERVRWFADHGMPQADLFLGPDRPPYVEAGMPPVVYVADDDALLQPWLAWVADEGRATFARYVATHPLYLLTEPWYTPERTFNNALGDRQFYAPLDMARVPLVDRVLALPTAVVLVVGAAACGWALGRDRWSSVLAVGLVVAALSVPHGTVAWHSDGMETARHLTVPALQLHLGVLLVVVGTVGAGRRAGGVASAQCHDGRCPGAWLVASVPLVGSMLSAGPRTRGTGRRGLIGAWHRPH